MMKKILVPFDGSETALRALEFAAGIGKPFGSEIMVVNVIVPYDYTKVPPRKPKNAIEEAEIRLRLISLKVFWISWAALPHPIV